MSLHDIYNYVSKTAWEPEHWSHVDWSQLWNMNDYIWQPGVTPFSQPIVPFATVVAYLAIIWFLSLVMRNLSPFNTNVINAVHNLVLSIWSLIMCVGTMYFSFQRAYEYGSPTQLVCEHSNEYVSGPLYFFAYWYYLSKYYELLDTVILCLRKRPLTVLHVYHHSIVILVTYLWAQADYALHWWCVWLNTSVHVFMYFYFFLISLGIKIPNSMKRLLTSLQIGQFCVYGIVALMNLCLTVQDLKVDFAATYPDANPSHDIGSQVFVSISYTHSCHGSLWILGSSVLVNITILLLFLNFFNQTYNIKKQTTKFVRDSYNDPPTCKDKLE